MPPYDEAIVALDLDGSPVWRWRPREVDNADLAFGAAPNLFTAVIGGREREVVGVGNKDGTYYLLDRDGVNEVTDVAWNDADPGQLPYWRTNVVPGGTAGGIIATAAVDDAADRIYFSTAPGSFATLGNPQRPTVHALDAGTGAILWQNTAEPTADASFAPTSAIPGVVFVGSATSGTLRSHDAATGARLGGIGVGFALAAAPAIADGTVLVGAGTGARSSNPSSPGEIASRTPQNVTALCVPGTAACLVDVPVAGRTLKLRDRAAEAKRRRLALELRDDAIAPPAAGGAADPTIAGATLAIRNPVTGEAQSIPLPAGGWQAVKEGFRYRDGGGTLGPCTRVRLSGGRVSARCRGAGVTFTLDEPAQGSLAAGLVVGAERVYCGRFGGTVGADAGLGGNGRGRFTATGAPPPAGCEVP
jgi:outer membrane protein assembly factor BamB